MMGRISLEAFRRDLSTRPENPSSAMTVGHTRAPSRGVFRPGFANRFAQRKEGAGNAGCLLHPRSRAQSAREVRTRAYRYSRSIPAFPAQWFYGLWRAPRRRIRLASVADGLKDCPNPVGPWKTSVSLTPATGARTTRFCRTQLCRSSARCARSRTKARPANTTTRPTLLRPPHPAPTFVTMANAPLAGRDGASL